MAKYNISGNMQWATIIGGYSTDNIQGIATDDEGNLFLGGRISSYVDLDPTPAVYGLVASGSDGFVAKYGCFPIDIVAAKDTFCEGEIITLNALNDCNGCSYSYTWTDVMGGTTITTTTPSYSFSGSVGTNQIIIQASESSCSRYFGYCYKLCSECNRFAIKCCSLSWRYRIIYGLGHSSWSILLLV